MVSDPYYDNVVLLTHAEDDPPLDISSSGHTIVDAGAGAVINTGPAIGPKFGSLCMDHNNSSTGVWFVEDTLSDFYFPADFTIEGWWYDEATVNGTENYYGVWRPADSKRGWSLNRVGGTNIQLQYSTDGINAFVAAQGVMNAPSEEWYHLAAVRVINTFWIFVNGNIVATNTVSANIFDAVWPGNIGPHSGSGANDRHNGYSDEHRWTKGVGRYTEAFTPPDSFFGGVDGQIILPNTGLLNADGTRIVNSNTARRPLKYVGALRSRS